MSHNCDVVIVGGGYAGLSCATAAAARGLKVKLLERKNDLGEKIRTTGILVGEAAAEVHPPEHLVRDIPGVRLYAPNGGCMELRSPGYAFKAVNTPDFMRWMGRQAEANGAEIRLSSNVTRAEELSDAVWIRGHGIQARYAVGADGARSNFARLLGYQQNTEFLVGAEVEMTGVRGLDESCLHVFVDTKLAPGYIAWAVPGVGVTQFGVAVRKPLKPDMNAVLERMRGHFDLGGAEVVERRGGLIPCGGAHRDWYSERSLLLGDAAGWVSPLTAGGIHPSLQVGKLAGQAIADTLAGKIAHPAEILEAQRPRYRAKQAMRWLMDHAAPPNWLWNVGIGNPVLSRVAQLLFFHHRGLKDPKAWKEMIFSGERRKL